MVKTRKLTFDHISLNTRNFKHSKNLNIYGNDKTGKASDDSAINVVLLC